MKVVVIGGVAAGMSAAARLRRLKEDAEIIVLERSPHVSFANCGLPYHIGGVIQNRDALLLQTPAGLRASLNLDVRTGHEALTIDRVGKTVEIRELNGGKIYTERYDKLVLCPGAQPLRPPLPGLDHPAIMVLRNIPDMDAILGKIEKGVRQAVVIGGGFIGVEMAESLRERGLMVSLVEMQPQLLPPLDPEMAWPLEEHSRRSGVDMYLGMAAEEFFAQENGRVQVKLKDGTRLDADLVILSAGVKPDVALARAAGLEIGTLGGIKVDEYLRTSDPDIYAAGDAIESPHRLMDGPCLLPLAGPANRQGRTVGDNLAGVPTPWGGVMGTSIVKVFEMTGGGTGLNEKTLICNKTPYKKVYLHPGQHAGYYPGAKPLRLKVLFAPDTGKLLGAQVVGFEGVDKRIDVLATAIQAGLTVFDIQHLELAYAPPYGSAKDPVNMAGFIGSNLLKGDIRLWYAEDFPEKTSSGIILDVMSVAEFSQSRIRGAINIPITQLRARTSELPRDKPIFVYCKVGFRSYLAMRILDQLGYKNVSTLSGGVDAFKSWHRKGMGIDEERRADIPYTNGKPS